METGTATVDLKFRTDNVASVTTIANIYEGLLDFVGGCFGGVAGVVVGHPFDTVKPVGIGPLIGRSVIGFALGGNKACCGTEHCAASVRLQTQPVTSSSTVSNPAIEYAAVVKKFPIHTINTEVVAPHLYRGTWNCFSSVVKEEGVMGLYKGLLSPLAGLGFINAIIFGVQANTLRVLGDQTLSSHMIAGSAAGGVQCIIACPMELAKVRMQLQGQGESPKYYQTHSHKYRGSIDCIFRIYQQEGLRGCFRGMSATMYRDIPGFTIYFGAYEFLCSTLQKRKGGDQLGLLELIFAGGLSGTCSWIVSHPIDVIKSRLQADGITGESKYRGSIDCIRKSIRIEGYRVFLNGLTANLMRAFPVNAATFTVYTYFMRYTSNTGQHR
ncbi:mitochondrial basic amino acids transporter-like [Glandiceps talaboti]